jgi:hypothetical protein
MVALALACHANRPPASTALPGYLVDSLNKWRVAAGKFAISSYVRQPFASFTMQFTAAAVPSQKKPAQETAGTEIGDPYFQERPGSAARVGPRRD